MGSVAAIHLIDMVVADNNKVGFEFVGADGIQPKSMSSETKVRVRVRVRVRDRARARARVRVSLGLELV